MQWKCVVNLLYKFPKITVYIIRADYLKIKDGASTLYFWFFNEIIVLNIRRSMLFLLIRSSLVCIHLHYDQHSSITLSFVPFYFIRA